VRLATEWRPPSREVKAVAEACRQRVTTIVPAARVILYGSRAREDARPESDYDLLILLPDGTSEADEQAIDESIYALELGKGAIVSTLVFPQQTWSTPLYRSMPSTRPWTARVCSCERRRETDAHCLPDCACRGIPVGEDSTASCQFSGLTRTLDNQRTASQWFVRVQYNCAAIDRLNLDLVIGI